MKALDRKEQHAMTQIVAKLRAAEKPKAARRSGAAELLDANERSDDTMARGGHTIPVRELPAGVRLFFVFDVWVYFAGALAALFYAVLFLAGAGCLFFCRDLRAFGSRGLFLGGAALLFGDRVALFGLRGLTLRAPRALPRLLAVL